MPLCARRRRSLSSCALIPYSVLPSLKDLKLSQKENRSLNCVYFCHKNTSASFVCIDRYSAGFGWLILTGEEMG